MAGKEKPLEWIGSSFKVKVAEALAQGLRNEKTKH
jgi:hypothetical protein